MATPPRTAGLSPARQDGKPPTGADGGQPAEGQPGAAAVPHDTSCTMRTRLYRRGRLQRENFPVAEISDLLAEPDTVVWLDLRGPEPHDLGLVSEEFGLHPLAVEDALNCHQRPKVDRYDTHLFLNAYEVHLDRASGQLTTNEVSAFVTAHALVTVRRDGFDMAPVLARWDASPQLLERGVGFLVHGLLDHVVDGHFAAVQDLDDEIEGLEDLLFEDGPHDKDVQRRSYELRKSLVLLRRVVVPMREVVATLMRREVEIVDAAMRPYYEDVYDHVVRATEWTESLRDLVSTVVETNINMQGQRLSVITKKVTSWAAIIAVPTAVTGFYGQNVKYPGFGTSWGFWFSNSLLIVLSVGLYVAFRIKDWL